jgi:hypothetical protein
MASTLSQSIYDALGSELIDSSIKEHTSIYNKKPNIDYKYAYEEAYTYYEIEHLLKGLQELGIESVTEFNVSADNVYDKLTSDNTLVDKIWDSRLLAGVVTKQVSSRASSIVKIHKNAYESSIKVLRSIEIKSLLDVIGNSKIDDFKLTNISIDTIKAKITHNSSNVVDSYIMLNTISEHLKNSNSIVIPNTDYDKSNKYITPLSIISVLDGMKALGFDNADIDISALGTDKKIEQYAEAFNSNIIRATVTAMIKIDSADADTNIVGVIHNKAELTTDMSSNNITIISKEELVNIVSGFKSLYPDGSGSYEFEFNMAFILNLNSDVLDVLLKSNLFNVVISNNLIKLYTNPLTNPFNYADEIQTVKIILIDKNRIRDNYQLLSATQIKDFVTYYRGIIGY